MKKLFILLLSALSLTAFAQQKKVAVYVTGEQSGVSKVLGDQLVAAFAKSGKYTAVERTTSFLAELGKEQGYQRSGVVSDNDIARLGVQFGVQMVCVADISEVFEQKYVSTRLIDVETAEIVNTASASSPMNSMSDLLNVSNSIATQLAGKTAREIEQEEQLRIAQERERKQKEEEERRERLRQEEIRRQQIESEKRRERENMEMAVLRGYIDAGQIMFTIPVKMTYAKAKSTAMSSKLGGYSDWRIPTDSEMARVLRIIENYYDKYHIEALHHPLKNEFYMCKGGHYCYNGKYDWGLAAGDTGYCIIVR